MPSLLSRFRSSPSRSPDPASRASFSSDAGESITEAGDSSHSPRAPTLLVQDEDADQPQSPPSPASLHRPSSFDHPSQLPPQVGGLAPPVNVVSKKPSIKRLSKFISDSIRPHSASALDTSSGTNTIAFNVINDDFPTPLAELPSNNSNTAPLSASSTSSTLSTTSSALSSRSRSPSISSATPTPTPTPSDPHSQPGSHSRRSSMASATLAPSSFGQPLTPTTSAPPTYRSTSPPPTTTNSLSRTSSRRSQKSLDSPSFSTSNTTTTTTAPSSTTSSLKQPWRRTSTASRKSSVGPSGGIASALASSGMALSAGLVSPSASSLHASLPQHPNPRARKPSSVNTTHSTSSRAHHRATSASSLALSNSSNSSGSDNDDDDSALLHDGLSPDGLDIDIEDEDIPSITGFAVASSKRNSDFHDLFPEVGGDDYLIEDYGCALQREILIQGRLYISENHICFHANIFGWVTNLTIPFSQISGIEKRMTAFVIPNAIMICTSPPDAKQHTFASFLSRDTTFDVMVNIWRLSRPTGGESASGSFREGSILEEGEEGEGEEGGGRALTESPTQLLTPTPSTARNNTTTTTTTMQSFTGAAATSTLPSGASSPSHPHSHHPQPHSPIKRPASRPAHRPTQCACGKRKEHFSDVIMDCTFPGTPEMIYNLMFASGFVKDFLVNEQNLRDLQMSDWKPEATGSQLLSRNMSYIKPLNGSVGPKQTRCELRDETLHADFDDYVCTMTTTRTPDVPSGSAFAVKTRTCIMWAGAASTKVLVTTAVEWSGRSFIKSIIDRSCLDGQKTYHKDLERAVRAYVHEHRGEFIPEGIEAEEAAAPEPAPSAPADVPEALPDTVAPASSQRAKLDGMRGLQWILDTVEGATGVARQSFWGAIDLIGDVIQDWNWTTVLALVVFGLVVSNVWTLVSLRQARGREELTRSREREGVYGKVGGVGGGRGQGQGQGPGMVVLEEGGWREDKVASVATEAVKAFLEEMARQKNAASADTHTPIPMPPTPREEVEALARALDDIERRVGDVKARLLSELD